MTKLLSRGDRLLVTGRGVTRAGELARCSAFAVALPAAAAGQWCLISLEMAGGGHWWAKVEAEDTARGQVVREAFLGPIRRFRGCSRRSILLHVPYAANGLSLLVFSRISDAACVPAAAIRVLGRREASARLLLGGWRKLPGVLRGRRLGLAGRLRAVLGQAPSRKGEAPPYAVWIDLYGRWGEAERAALTATRSAAISMEVALVAGTSGAALAASLASVAAQWSAPAAGISVIRTPADWRRLSGDWIVVLDAGEILAPHALTCFARAIERSASSAGFLADFDVLDAHGDRWSPSFRPTPDPWLLRSTFFAPGAAVFSRHAHADLWPSLEVDADRARLALARSAPHWTGGAETLQRLPLILTHRANPGPAEPVRAHAGVAGGPLPFVSIIVPSACRSPHVLQCLRKVLSLTDYPCFEILLAVTSVDGADARQASIMAEASRLPHTQVIELRMPAFNYATVNNAAASHARGEMLLLLNDDVAPIGLDWLRRLVSYSKDKYPAGAGIVGARLLYGNGMVQHAGVIMGFGNLCEHGFRLADRKAIGPYGLARLGREVSAVTAACLLVERRLFARVGGLDEGFRIALNDVDFCLRARATGARIMFAADVELYHFESVSLGRHYQGTRAALEAIEVRKLRERWQDVILGDPFYNPCASLEPGREFQPGFPPRQTPQSWIAQ